MQKENVPMQPATGGFVTPELGMSPLPNFE